MFPNMVNPYIQEQIDFYKSECLGWKISGAGGGGYLVLIAEQPIKNGMLTEYDSLPKVIKIEGRDVHLSDTGIVQSEYQDYQNRSIITDGAILQVWGDMEKSFANAEFKNVKMIT